MTIDIKGLGLLAGAIVLSACAGNPFSVTAPQVAFDLVDKNDLGRPGCSAFIEEAANDKGFTFRTTVLKEFLVAKLPEHPSAGKASELSAYPRVNDLLDCLVVEMERTTVATDGTLTAGALEARLLRGHFVVATLAAYGSFNITGEVDPTTVDFRPYSEMGVDAGRMLSSIRKSQIRLRAASTINGIKGNSDALLLKLDSIPLSGVETATVIDARRVETVLQLSLDAERPTVRRARRAIIDLFVGIASQNPKTILTVASDVINGLEKSFKVGNRARHYLTDGRSNLFRITKEFNAIGGDATKKAAFETRATRLWHVYDNIIYGACNRLAQIASTVHDCVPGMNDFHDLSS